MERFIIALVHCDESGMSRILLTQNGSKKMNTDDEAKVAGAVGGVAGAAGAVGTVAAAGSVAGLGAAGITSGLAAVGSVVGGGMVAGLAVTAAAPVAIGAAAYGLYKWLKD